MVPNAEDHLDFQVLRTLEANLGHQRTQQVASQLLFVMSVPQIIESRNGLG